MYSILRNFTILIVYALFISACSSGGGDDPANNGGGGGVPSDSEIQITIQDAHAGSVNSDLVMTFSGIETKEGGVIITSKSFLEGDDKKITLSVPMVNQDTQLNILSKASGYLDSGSSLILTADQDFYEANLKMVKSISGQAAKGIFTAEMDISPYVDENGKALSAITLESKQDALSPGVSITIPADTLLTDDSNNPVIDGILKVTSFDPAQPKALAAYPGGLNVIADATGFTALSGNAPFTGDAAINFKTGGFAAITITGSNGKKVKNFSQDVSITMEVKEGTQDSDGVVVGAGTTIPIWSYDEDTGKWSFESQEAMLSGVTGGFSKVTQVTRHLTYWNIDWHYGDKCAPRFNFLNPDGSADLSSYSFKLVVESVPTVNRWFSENWYNNDGFIQFKNVPANFPGKLEIFENGALVKTVDVANFCKSGATPQTGNDTSVSEIFDVTMDCQNCLVSTDIMMEFACPAGTPSNIGFAALLSPISGNSGTALGADGTGSVMIPSGSSVTFDVAANISQAGLFAAVTNPQMLPITVDAGTTSTTVLNLSDAYCSSAVGTISCNDVTNPDPDGKWSPFDVVKGSDGNRYASVQRQIADPNSPNLIIEGKIEKVDSSGARTTLVEYGVPQSQYSTLTAVSEVRTKSPAGMDLYKTNQGDILVYTDSHCVNALMLSTMQVVTIAGRCDGAYGDNDTGAHASLLHFPKDVAFNGDGSKLYISDYLNRKVKVLYKPFAAAPIPSVLVNSLTSMTANDTWQSMSFDVSNYAGSGLAPTDDTYGTTRFNSNINPYMLDFAPNDGSIVISEYRSHRVTRINDDGMTRLAGFFEQTGGPIVSGVASTDATVKLRQPADIEIDALGNILLADEQNHVVRMISSNGTITTVAGTGGHSGGMGCPVTGGPYLATQVNIARPNGLWIDELDSGFHLTQKKNGVYNGFLRKVSDY